MEASLNLISNQFQGAYASACEIDWGIISEKLELRAEYRVDDFEYYIAASSVFSSKIEGNSLDLNSFLNNRKNKDISKKKEYREIEDLVNAYRFAAKKELTQENFLAAHKLLSEKLLKAKERGKYRKNTIGVFDNTTGRPIYVAVEPEFVTQEVTKLFADINAIINSKPDNKMAFYYASMVHLWIAMIHPFADGNGRIARLVEKWFLAAAIGEAAWSINSEKYYWDHRNEYYRNISLGYNYYALKWERCIPFLVMLPDALKTII